MKLQKSVLGTIVILLFSAFYLSLCALTIHEVFTSYASDTMNQWMIPTIILSVMMLGITFLIGFFSGKWSAKAESAPLLSKKQSKLLGSLLFICLICVFFVLRIRKIWEIDLTQLDQSNLDQSIIGGTKIILSKVQSNLDFLFGQLISGIFAFLGNQIYAVLFLQVLLQCSAFVILYKAIKKNAGFLVSLLTVLVMGTLPSLQHETGELTSEVFFFFLLSIGIYALFCSLCDQSVFKSMFSGIAIALVCFVDRIGVLFLLLASFFMLIAYTSGKKELKRNNEEIQSDGTIIKKDQRILALLLRIFAFFMAFAAAGFALFCYKGSITGISIAEQLQNFLELEVFSVRNLRMEFFRFVSEAYLEIPVNLRIFMLLPVFLWILFYWKSKTDIGFGFVICFMGIHICEGLASQTQYKWFLILSWILMSMTGIKGFLTVFVKKRTVTVAMEQKVSKDMESIITEPIITEPIITESIVTEPILSLQKDEQTFTLIEEENGRFLDNPLPVPKKHVKKVMGYAFDPDESEMHYDLNELKTDDDYDIR